MSEISELMVKRLRHILLSKAEVEKKGKNVYITIGISGCGKSKHRRDDCMILNKDQFRFMFLDYKKTKMDFLEELEPIVKKMAKLAYIQLLENGFNVYVDETNLIPEKRRFYLEKALEHGYNVHFFIFKNHDQARFNNSRRERKVPEKILNMQERFFTSLTHFERINAKSIKIFQNSEKEFNYCVKFRFE